jgi:RimJ/RimL family protein N-acetyltransferase
MEFILRPWQLADLDHLVAAANNYEIARFMTNQFPHPYTEENGKAFIEYALRSMPPNIMAIVVDGIPAGGIGVHPQSDIHCRNAELGYWLAQPYWGRGIVSGAVKQMVEYAFDNWDIDRLFARPFGSNTASQKVLEKSGFALEARLNNTIFKNGSYEDELIYALRKK